MTIPRKLGLFAAAGVFIYLLLVGTMVWVSYISAVRYQAPGTPRLLAFFGAAAVGLFMYGIPALALLGAVASERFGAVRKPVFALLLVEAAALVWLRMHIKEDRKFCETCDYVVGGIDFNRPGDRMMDEDMTRRFGPGCAAEGGSWARRRYSFPKAGAAVLISMSRLQLMRAASGDERCAAVVGLKTYTTGKGIGLGDSVRKVLDTYGDPTERFSGSSGEEEFIYRKPGNAMSFHCKSGAVESIELFGP